MDTKNDIKKKDFIQYLSIFLLIINIGLSFLLIEKNNVINALKKTSNECDTSMKNILLKNEHYARVIGWLQLPKQISFSPNQKLMKENGDSITLSNLVGKKPKLFFKYSELNCNVCVDAQLAFLKTFIKNYGEENLIMISSYKFHKTVYQFKILNNIRSEIYNINFLDPSIDNLNVPYYFILDDTYIPKMMFIPEKTFTEDTEAYFKKIQNMYFSLK